MTTTRRRLVLVVLALLAGTGVTLYLLAGDALAVRLVVVVLVGTAVLGAFAVLGQDADEAPRGAGGMLDSHAQAQQITPRRHEPTSADADEITADMATAAPGGSSSGWWDGLDAYGPGYALGTVFGRTNEGTWPDGGPGGDHGDPVMCSGCGRTHGLALLWLDGRPDLAVLRCPCGVTWRDPAWATAAAVAAVLAQDTASGPGPTAADDADPAVAYVGEMLRREAGNTPPPVDEAP